MADEKDQKPDQQPDESKKKPDEELDFEIESPEESRIKQDTSGKVSEIVEQAEEPQEAEEGFEEFDESGSFWDQLKRLLGISRKRLFGCLFIILIGGGLIYFLLSGGLDRIRDLFSKESGEKPIPEEVEEETPQKPPSKSNFFRETGLYSSLTIGNRRGLKFRTLPATFRNAYLFGREENFSELLSQQQDVIETNFMVGFRGEPGDRFARYVNTIGAVQNALNTDIFALLDATSDRSAALRRHIEELENLLDVSRQMATFVLGEMTTLRLQFDSLSPAKNQTEDEFFLAVESFRGEQSTEILDRFIETSQELVDIRARNLALNKLRILYDSALIKLEARIRDIKANQEALIKGVRVFDIQNSDLDLILSGSQAGLE